MFHIMLIYNCLRHKTNMSSIKDLCMFMKWLRDNFLIIPLGHLYKS